MRCVVGGVTEKEALRSEECPTILLVPTTDIFFLNYSMLVSKILNIY